MMIAKNGKQRSGLAPGGEFFNVQPGTNADLNTNVQI
jgi:hypothetical protein